MRVLRRPLAALFLVPVATIGAVLAACSSTPAKHLHAAEPATAPAQDARPAGTVRAVGALPEGIVYDPASGLVAVAVRSPDRLQLLDPNTLAVRRSVALPGSVRHLQVGQPGTVLVPDETARELLQVSLPSGRIVATTKVGKQPHDAAQVGDDVVVGNEFGHSLSVIRDGRVVRTVGGVRQPGGVVGDAGNIAVVIDVAKFTVSTFDTADYRRTAILQVGKGPTHGELISGNRVLVADTRGNAVLVVSVRPLKQVGRLTLPGTPYGMASDPSTGTVWVTLTARNEVVGIDVASSKPRVIARYRTVRQPNTVAVAPGSHTLWVTGTHDGVVERITR